MLTQKNFGIGTKLNRDCLNILYLMFTDDFIIFVELLRKLQGMYVYIGALLSSFKSVIQNSIFKSYS